MSVRLGRMQRALFEALDGVADVVAWGRGTPPRGAGSHLSMALGRCVSRPVAKAELFPISTVQLRVTGAPALGLARARLNGLDVRRDIGAAETIEEVRDAFLVAMGAAEDAGRVTVAAVGTDRIDVSSAVLGGLWALSAGGALEEVDASRELAASAVKIQISREVHEVTLAAFSRDTAPRSSAHAIMTLARARLESPARKLAMAALGTQGWAKGDAIDLSAIAGANWESRAELPIECAYRSVHVEPLDVIESAEFTIEAVAAI